MTSLVAMNTGGTYATSIEFDAIFSLTAVILMRVSKTLEMEFGEPIGMMSQK